MAREDHHIVEVSARLVRETELAAVLEGFEDLGEDLV